jgi:adenine-specific DNA methylase
MGEKDYTHATNYIEYFITRSLDLLNSGGLLVFIVGAEVASGGVLFLDSQPNKVKASIAEKADLIDAYRLPNGVFERTDVVSDIIVLKKK